VTAVSLAGCSGPVGETDGPDGLAYERAPYVDFGAAPGSPLAAGTISVSPVDAWGDVLAAGLAELDRSGAFSRFVLASLRESRADAVALREILAVAPPDAEVTYGQILGTILEERYPIPLRRLGALGSGRVVDMILDDMVHAGELYSINLHVPALNETDTSQQPYISPGVEVGDDLIYGYRAADDTLEAREISEGFARRTPVIVLDPSSVVEQRVPRLATYSLGVFDGLRTRDLVVRDDHLRVEKRVATSSAEATIKAPASNALAACSWPAINPRMDWFVVNQKWESWSDGAPEVYYSYSTYSLWHGHGNGAQEDYIKDSVSVNKIQYPDETVDTKGSFCDGNDYLWLTIYEYDWYAGMKYSQNSITGDIWYHQYKARYANEVYYDNAWHSDPVSYWQIYYGDYTLYGGAGTFHLLHP
jgi:hypothetical protein